MTKKAGRVGLVLDDVYKIVFWYPSFDVTKLLEKYKANIRRATTKFKHMHIQHMHI